MGRLYPVIVNRKLKICLGGLLSAASCHHFEIFKLAEFRKQTQCLFARWSHILALGMVPSAGRQNTCKFHLFILSSHLELHLLQNSIFGMIFL